MMNSNNTKRAFKGVMLNFYLDFRKYLIAGAAVTLAITLFNFFATIIKFQSFKYYGEDIYSIFIIGYIVMIIAICPYILLSSSGGIKKKFMFPINRFTYSAANFVSIILGSLAMLMLVTMIAPIEIILFKVASLSSERIFFISEITLSNFATGFISSWAYMIALASVLHFILIFLKRYKITALIVLVAIIVISSIVNIDAISFVIMEHNFGMLILKLSAITVASHLLAFISTRNLEVI